MKHLNQYDQQTYHNEVKQELLERLKDELPTIFAVVAVLLKRKVHVLKICDFLAPYTSEGDIGDREIDIIIETVRDIIKSEVKP